MKFQGFLLAALFALAPCASFGDDESEPVMLSLLSPIEWPSPQSDVCGFRFSLLYGECRDFTGLDIGLVGRATDGFAGLSIGGVNIVSRRLAGLQLGLINWNSNDEVLPGRRSIGVQYGVVNYAETLFGLQDGWANLSSGTLTGVQYGFFNCAADVSGLQCGCLLVLGVNIAGGSVSGCQIGIVNYADKMGAGLQIGLLNIILHNGFFPVLPIFNGSF